MDYSGDDVPNVVIGVAHAAASDNERRPIGAIVEVPEDNLPEFLFNVDFISPKMLEFVEKPRAAVFILCAAVQYLFLRTHICKQIHISH